MKKEYINHSYKI